MKDTSTFNIGLDEKLLLPEFCYSYLLVLPVGSQVSKGISDGESSFEFSDIICKCKVVSFFFLLQFDRVF